MVKEERSEGMVLERNPLRRLAETASLGRNVVKKKRAEKAHETTTMCPLGWQTPGQSVTWSQDL